MRYIWISGHRLYYYDTYNSWKEAYNMARYFKRRNKSRYFILTYEHGFWLPQNKYRLYLDKVMRFG